MRMLTHLPTNHRLRGLYRFLAALAGLYVLALGIVGLAVTWGQPAFAHDDTQALGLRTNLAFSVMSIVVGAVVLLGILIDHNWDQLLNFFGGIAFLVVGMLMLGLMETDLNVFNYNVTKCVVSFIIGIVLFLAGLYSRVGSEEDVAAMEAHRHHVTA
jgi:hypothetical protein